MVTNKETPEEKQVRDEYFAIIDELERWGIYVDGILNEYVGSCFPSTEHVQIAAAHRVKTIDSYCEKVLLRYQFENPLLETTDKVGTRVVLLNRNGVKKVSEFIRSSEKWILQEQSRDTDSLILQQPDMFTYQSDHFIVKPNANYNTLQNRDLLTCEIQVRTLLQHAYAEISHDTVYKKNTITNNKAKRLLASSMAMLETADEKFVGLYKELEDTDNPFATLQTKIIGLYKQVFPSYSENMYDVGIANKLLLIYTGEELKLMLSELERFIKESIYNLKDILLVYSDKCVLFKHPIVIVALYGIINLQNKTKNNWPFSYESFKFVVESMNISLDSLR